MDYLKRLTCKDYTNWDLNCHRIVHIKNRQKVEAMLKRKARRKENEKLKYLLGKS